MSWNYTTTEFIAKNSKSKNLWFSHYFTVAFVNESSMKSPHPLINRTIIWFHEIFFKWGWLFVFSTLCAANRMLFFLCKCISSWDYFSSKKESFHNFPASSFILHFVFVWFYNGFLEKCPGSQEISSQVKNSTYFSVISYKASTIIQVQIGSQKEATISLTFETKHST